REGGGGGNMQPVQGGGMFKERVPRKKGAPFPLFLGFFLRARGWGARGPAPRRSPPPRIHPAGGYITCFGSTRHGSVSTTPERPGAKSVSGQCARRQSHGNHARPHPQRCIQSCAKVQPRRDSERPEYAVCARRALAQSEHAVAHPLWPTQR